MMPHGLARGRQRKSNERQDNSTMPKLSTTLKGLRDASACKPRYAYLRKSLGPKYGDTTPITMLQILEHNGRQDTLWAIDNCIDGGDKILRFFACDCAEHVLPIWEKQYPNDQRVKRCILVARRFALGAVTQNDLAAARDAAWAAAREARAAWAARDTAAAAAVAAAWAAAREARAASWAAAWAASWVARDAASTSAWAARDAAWAAEEQWQIERLKTYLVV
jgi:hypothetical protein